MKRRKEEGGPLDSSQVFHVSHTVGYLPYTFQRYMNVHIQGFERGKSIDVIQFCNSLSYMCGIVHFPYTCILGIYNTLHKVSESGS